MDIFNCLICKREMTTPRFLCGKCLAEERAAKRRAGYALITTALEVIQGATEYDVFRKVHSVELGYNPEYDMDEWVLRDRHGRVLDVSSFSICL